MRTYVFSDLEDFIERCVYAHMIVFNKQSFWLSKKDISYLVQFIIVFNFYPEKMPLVDQAVADRLEEEPDKVLEARRRLLRKRWLRKVRDGYDIPPQFNFKEKGLRMDIAVRYEMQGDEPA